MSAKLNFSSPATSRIRVLVHFESGRSLKARLCEKLGCLRMYQDIGLQLRRMFVCFSGLCILGFTGCTP